LSNETLNKNSDFKNKYLRNVYYIILIIRDSNISLSNININEITSGVFNPDGLLNLLLLKLEEFHKINKMHRNLNATLNDQSESDNNSNGRISINDSKKNESIIHNDRNKNETSNFSHLDIRKIYLFNNVLDFSLKYHSNYTISSYHKSKDKKLFYSTKQPELVPLLFYQGSLEYSGQNIIKLHKEIMIIRSQRKTDIIQCLKVKL
jgi:hypothetical protein